MSKTEYRTFAEMPDDVLRSFADALAEIGRKAEEKMRRKRRRAVLGIQRANCLHPLSDRYQIEEDAYQCLGPSPFKDLVFYCRACGAEVGRVAAHSSAELL